MTTEQETIINNIIEGMRLWLMDDEAKHLYIDQEFARKYVLQWHNNLLKCGTWRKNG